MDEFMARALLAGSAMVLATGPLGCFVVWGRMAYFGDALAHTALLGVVLGLVLGVAPVVGVIAVCVAVAMVLARSGQGARLAGDSWLGILSHGALALGLVALSSMDRMRVDLMGWLFGDILGAGWADGLWTLTGAAVVWLALARQWRCLVAASVDEDLARVEGHDVARGRMVLMVLVALTVAGAMKVVGVMLVTALLVIPAAAARSLARTPEQMAGLAVLAGWLAVAGGLWGSWLYDTPSGPSIVVVAVLVFLLSRFVPQSGA
jgi:zinc transport system permease protein